MKNFSIRLPAEQRVEIDRIAKLHGIKPADVLRLAIRKLVVSELRKKGAR